MQSPRDAPPHENGAEPASVSMPGIAPAVPLDRMSVEVCLLILAAAGFESPRDRAAFYSRDAQRVGSSWGEGDFSFNQALLERFVEREAERLGWKQSNATPEIPRADGFYMTMHQLPEGMALARLTQAGVDKPPLVEFLGQVFPNDNYAATAALIDEVAGTFSKRARGVVTVAVDDSEPDTFFRRIEHANLMANPDVLHVRALSALADRTAFERLERAELRNIEFAERIFDKHEWNQWQREQWLGASIVRLLRNSDGASRARFFGEILLLCNEIDRLQRSPDRAGAEQLLPPELGRLTRCAALLERHPEVLHAPLDAAFADPFAALTLKGYRGRELPSGGLLAFASDQLARLTGRMHEALHLRRPPHRKVTT